LGDLAGSGLEGVPVGFWPEVAWVGKGKATPALGEPCASFGLGGFRGSSAVFSAGGLGGLSTFRDSLPIRALFAKESGLISWGTLHRGSRIKK
jgi:hypothetical protein